ncbi:hypothetical protein BGZ83_012195 [Gryganskiella cystojenkinii]|nr:hypothetical protein BGZ83_012195 [Gryganskiella cystojenkinii]
MHSPGLTQADIGVFMADVELLMRDCSQANIQAGKNWIATNCHNPQQIDILARAIVAIAISRRTFDEKLHLVYLVNDILSHSDRKQLPWIKDALYPHLVAILRVAYYFPGIDDTQRNRVIKVLGIWRDRAFFPPHVLDTLETDVKRPPLLPGSAAAPPNQHPHIASQHTQNFQYPQAHEHHPSFSQQPLQPPAIPHGQWPPAQHLHQQPPPNGPYSDAMARQQGQGVPNSTHGQSQNQLHHQQPHLPPQQHQQQYQLHPQHPFHQQQHQPLLPQTQHNSQASPPHHHHHSGPALVPERTHRDAFTRDLPAALMLSKIDSEARFYEPMPTEVSIPLKRDESKQAAVVKAVADFLAEDQASQSAERTAPGGEEGWHPGYLDQFYVTEEVAVVAKNETEEEEWKIEENDLAVDRYLGHGPILAPDHGLAIDLVIEIHDINIRVDLVGVGVGVEVEELVEEVEALVEAGAEAEREAGAETEVEEGMLRVQSVEE